MDPRCQCEKVVADSVGQDKKAGGGVRGGVQTERRREGGVRGRREGRGGSSLLPGVQLHAMRFCGGGSVGSPLWPLFLAACLLRSSPSLDGDGKRFHRAFLPSQRRKGGSYSTVQYSHSILGSAAAWCFGEKRKDEWDRTAGEAAVRGPTVPVSLPCHPLPAVSRSRCQWARGDRIIRGPFPVPVRRFQVLPLAGREKQLCRFALLHCGGSGDSGVAAAGLRAVAGRH